MKLRFVQMISAALLWLCASAASAQAYHQLTIDDFEGAPHLNTGVIAYTNCSISFEYVAHHMSNYYRLDFNIKLELNHEKSWMDKKSITSKVQLEQILTHEQGHFIIAYMEQQDLLRTVGRTVFYADYREQAAAIFDNIDAKYKKLNHDYDSDTMHMLNRDEQVSWDAYLRKQLEYMPPA